MSRDALLWLSLCFVVLGLILVGASLYARRLDEARDDERPPPFGFG